MKNGQISFAILIKRETLNVDARRGIHSFVNLGKAITNGRYNVGIESEKIESM